MDFIQNIFAALIEGDSATSLLKQLLKTKRKKRSVYMLLGTILSFAILRFYVLLSVLLFISGAFTIIFNVLSSSKLGKYWFAKAPISNKTQLAESIAGLVIGFSLVVASLLLGFLDNVPILPAIYGLTLCVFGIVWIPLCFVFMAGTFESSITQSSVLTRGIPKWPAVTFGLITLAFGAIVFQFSRFEVIKQGKQLKFPFELSQIHKLQPFNTSSKRTDEIVTGSIRVILPPESSSKTQGKLWTYSINCPENGISANLYSMPSLSSQIIHSIDCDGAGSIQVTGPSSIEKGEEWVPVAFDGISGWLMATALKRI